MFKLAIKMLFGRMKWFLLITISLGITLACIISLLTAADSIKISLQNNAYNSYGEHSGVLIGVEEPKHALLSRGNFDVGEYQLIDKLKINKNLAATIGWMDTSALKIGHIKLLEGTFPKNDNEVAIESFYLEKLDPMWKIGTEREIPINNTITEVKLVGIIDDYSAKWTVPFNIEKGVNDLPNIFMGNKIDDLRNQKNNYLIKFDKDNKYNLEKMSILLEKYKNKGMINEKLFFIGLKQYDNISTLTIMFQLLMLVVASICFWGLFYYFNLFQSQKDAQLKALGCSNVYLYNLRIIQCLFILITSLFFSIPLNVIFHKLIISNTFMQGDFKLTQVNILSKVFLWIVILFVVLVIISTKSIKKFKIYSINDLINNNNFYSNRDNKLSNKFSSFLTRQLAIQIEQFPKQSILMIISLCLSINVVIFSFFLEKESQGIWDAKQDYYIDAQEMYGYENIKNLNVLVNPGLTFPLDEVKRLEEASGIQYIEKNPFMIDVHPLIDPNLVVPSIKYWIEQNGSSNNSYDNDVIIPNVNYKIVSAKEFSKLFSLKEYDSFKGKILIEVPKEITNNQKNKELVGEKLGFIKMHRDSGQLKTKKWDFEIFDVITSEKSSAVGATMTIIFDEQTAVDSKIFTGYKDLTIYLEEDITEKEEKVIESLVYKMVAPIPGSLYQKIATTKIEDAKISSYIGFLGKLSFGISLFLSIISIISILLSKYYIKKRTWGIYQSLGMRKQSIVNLLGFEMMIYFFVSIVLSTLTFFLVMIVQNHIYSTMFYTVHYLVTVLLILIIATISIFVFGKIIKQQSILSLIRLDE